MQIRRCFAMHGLGMPRCALLVQVKEVRRSRRYGVVCYASESLIWEGDGEMGEKISRASAKRVGARPLQRRFQGKRMNESIEHLESMGWSVRDNINTKRTHSDVKHLGLRQVLNTQTQSRNTRSCALVTSVEFLCYCGWANNKDLHVLYNKTVVKCSDRFYVVG